MANFKPTMCGENELYIPDVGCSDCEKLEKRVKALEECCETSTEKIEKLEACCEDVNEQLNKKLEVQNILAGDNITIEQDGNNITISSTGGGGGCTCTKGEILNCIGVREMEMTITDTDGVDEEWYVLGRLKDEVIGDGSRISSCDCTKWELLDILGYQEIDLTMADDDGESRTWTVLGRPKEAQMSRARLFFYMQEPTSGLRMPESPVGWLDFAWDAIDIKDTQTDRVLASFGSGTGRTDEWGLLEIETNASYFGDEDKVTLSIRNLRSVDGYCPSVDLDTVTDTRYETVTDTETVVTYNTDRDIANYIAGAVINSIKYNE